MSFNMTPHHQVFEPYSSDVSSCMAKAHDELRKSGSSFCIAMAQKEKLKEWSPYQQEKGYLNSSTSVPDLGIVKRAMDYLDSKYHAAWNSILEDTFKCIYYMYFDIGRPAILGAQAIELEVVVKWDVKDVVVKMYNGAGVSVSLKPQLCWSTSPSTIDRKVLRRACGFEKASMDKLGIAEFSKLNSLIAIGSHVQDKLTRLVKGVLLCLDIATSPAGLHFDTSGFKEFVVYNVENLCNEYDSEGTSYLYCEAAYEHHFKVFGCLMMDEYPHPRVATDCKVRIPADGRRRVVLVQEQMGDKHAVTLTFNNCWASLLTYADDIGCSHLLEKAIVIAGCLRENRYLSSVRLPMVVSRDELIKPCLTAKPRSSMEMVWLSPAVCRALGRMTQSQICVIVKDLVTAVVGKKEKPRRWIDVLQSLSMYPSSLLDANFDVPMVRFVSEMLWFGGLSSEDVHEIMSYSVFYSYWTMDSCERVAKGGLIKALRCGEIDGMSGKYADKRKTDQELVNEELFRAGLGRDFMPQIMGEFTTIPVCFRAIPKVIERKALLKSKDLLERRDYVPERTRNNHAGMNLKDEVKENVKKLRKVEIRKPDLDEEDEDGAGLVKRNKRYFG